MRVNFTSNDLGPSAVDIAKKLFSTMAAVFEEPAPELSDDYVHALLARRDFGAIVILSLDNIVLGGATAHVLPMTRSAVKHPFVG